MTILNCTLSVALGATIALAPVFAFAQDDMASTTPHAPFLPRVLNRIENPTEGDRMPLMRPGDGGASSSVRMNMDATSTRPMRMRANEDGGSTSMRMTMDASSTHPMRMREEEGMRNASTTPEERMQMHASTTQARIDMRATTRIDARVGALQKLSDRLSAAPRLPDGVKTALSATLATQMQELTTLKEKIGGDTSTTSMRDDAGNIRPEFRTYALVLPQAAITAGSNRILGITTQMDALGAKLSTRISDAAASSTVDVSGAQTAYADYTAKVADAKAQANAAAALVVNLTPDNGDKTIFATNSAALKSAAADLKTAQDDLKAARADVATILKAIKGTGVRAQATTTAQTN